MTTTTNQSYYVRDLNEWQVDAVKKILSFQPLTLTPNWDSYGSEPMNQRAIDVALNLVHDVGFRNIPAPRVIPVSGGGIQLEWVKENRELEVEIHPDGTIAYLVVHNGEPTSEDEIEPREVLLQTERLLSWLSTG